jgi:predicted HicB family RNase H-like nuclease
MKIKHEEAMAQLATRIPKSLHQRLKFHCVERDVALMDFVAAAIREKLHRKGSLSKEPRGR